MGSLWVLTLSAILLFSAYAHVRRFDQLVLDIHSQAIVRHASFAAALLVGVEVCVGMSLLLGLLLAVPVLVSMGSVATLLTAIVFVVYQITVLRLRPLGSSVPCGCGFGGSIGVESLARSVLVLFVSILVCVFVQGIDKDGMGARTWISVVPAACLALVVHLVPVAAERYRIVHELLVRSYGGEAAQRPR